MILMWLGIGPLTIVATAVAIYILGGCDGGLKGSAICHYLPNRIGEIAYLIMLVGIYPSIVWLVLSAAAAAIFERRARRMS